MCGEHRLISYDTLVCEGIIPACAGSTPVKVSIISSVWGSSPHVRGAPARPWGQGEARGDHPRMCGEHTPCTASCRHYAGSSPHVRGAPGAYRTCTGKTRDHPRMCGEHRVIDKTGVVPMGIIPACAGSTNGKARSPITSKGSSPHVRGARRDSTRPRGFAGIIPACAGSTCSAPCLAHVFRGSSPHVRGAPSI